MFSRSDVHKKNDFSTNKKKDFSTTKKKTFPNEIFCLRICQKLVYILSEAWRSRISTLFSHAVAKTQLKASASEKVEKQDFYYNNLYSSEFHQHFGEHDQTTKMKREIFYFFPHAN